MTLHMHSLPIDVRSLSRIGRGIGVPVRNLDLGYLVHATLVKMWGDDAPRPFTLEELPRGFVRLLGYSPADKSLLQERARAVASPDVYEAIRWDRHRAKPMPTAFKAGDRFRFQLRATPVKRRRGSGKEEDAFLVALGPKPPKPAPLDRVEGAPTRQEVYAKWLNERYPPGIEFKEIRLDSFKLTQFFRRTQDSGARKGAVLKRPDVTFSGVLEVSEAELFQETLRKGIGRHRAFGLGMLLLLPE